MLLGLRVQSKGVAGGGLARASQAGKRAGVMARREERSLRTGCGVGFAGKEAWVGWHPHEVHTALPGGSYFLRGAGSRRERPTC